jgi:hypothetical protein
MDLQASPASDNIGYTDAEEEHESLQRSPPSDNIDCMCMIDSCENHREKDFDLCTRHKCHVEGCPRPPFDYSGPKLSLYCHEHLCYRPKCTNRLLDGFNYCHDHLTYKDLVTMAKKERSYVPNDIWYLVASMGE